MSYEESSSPATVVMAVAVLAAAAALGWYFWSAREAMAPVAEDQPALPEVSVESRPEPEGPEFPLPAAQPDRSRPEALTPLPPLDDSDRYFELELSGLLGSGIADLLVDQALIEKVVATVDNLPRSIVSERIRPVGGLPDRFAVDGQDGSGQFTMNPANYDRYDLLVTMLARVDRRELTDVYRRFYPLFQEAYVELGYPDAYFNDRLVEVIDHLLATPPIEEPVALLRPHVLYEYENPDLEALSAGQKLMIRLGSEHRVVVNQFLEEIREQITIDAPPERP